MKDEKKNQNGYVKIMIIYLFIKIKNNIIQFTIIWTLCPRVSEFDSSAHW